MTAIGQSHLLRSASVLTFDCYGTLVDWSNGLKAALKDALQQVPADVLSEFFDRYLAAEKEVEAGTYRSYRQVVANAAAKAGQALGISIDKDQARRIGDSVGRWPPFPDSRQALSDLSRHCKLGILSNIDRDLINQTMSLIGVEFDFVVTAEDVKSYKPGLPHFESGRTIVDRLANGREVWIHVAQSLYHDGEPAKVLGLPFIWINRPGEEFSGNSQPVAEFGDMATFARTLIEAKQA